MYKQKARRFFSMLLCFTMLLSLCGMPAFADDTSESYTATLNVSGGYAYLVDADGNEYGTSDEAEPTEEPSATDIPSGETGYYSITVEEDTEYGYTWIEGSDITEDGLYAEGSDVMVTAMAYDGCYISGIDIMTEDGDVIFSDLYDTEETSAYTASFSMPSDNVIITVWYTASEGEPAATEAPAYVASDNSVQYSIPAGDTVTVLTDADESSTVTIMLDGMVIEGNTFTMPNYDVAVDVIIETSEEPTPSPTVEPSDPTAEPVTYTAILNTNGGSAYLVDENGEEYEYVQDPSNVSSEVFDATTYSGDTTAGTTVYDGTAFDLTAAWYGLVYYTNVGIKNVSNCGNLTSTDGTGSGRGVFIYTAAADGTVTVTWPSLGSTKSGFVALATADDTAVSSTDLYTGYAISEIQTVKNESDSSAEMSLSYDVAAGNTYMIGGCGTDAFISSVEFASSTEIYSEYKEYTISPENTVIILTDADETSNVTIMLNDDMLDGDTFVMPYYDVTVDVIIETSEEPAVTDAPSEPTATPEGSEFEALVYHGNAEDVTGGNQCDNTATYVFVEDVDATVAALLADADDPTIIDSTIIANYLNYIGGTSSYASHPSIAVDLEEGTYTLYYVGYNNESDFWVADDNGTVYAVSDGNGTELAYDQDNTSRVLKYYTIELDLTEGYTGNLTFDTDSSWLPDLYSVIISQEVAAEPTPTPTVEPSEPTGVTSVAWTAADDELNELVTTSESSVAFEYAMSNAPMLYGYGEFASGGSALSYTHTDGTTYEFPNGWQSGSGNTTKRCFYFSPEYECVVTVAYTAQSNRPVYIYQGGTLLASGEEGASDGAPATISAEITDPTAGDVYVYGGSSNKQIYGIFVDYYEEVIFSTPTPEPSEPTDAPTSEPTATPEGSEFEALVYHGNVEDVTGGNQCDNTATYVFVEDVDATVAALLADADDPTIIDSTIIANYLNYIGGTSSYASHPSIAVDLEEGTYTLYYVGYNNESDFWVADDNGTVYAVSDGNGTELAYDQDNTSRVLKYYTIELDLTEGYTGNLTFDTDSSWLPDLYSVIISQEAAAEPTPTPTVEPSVPTTYAVSSYYDDMMGSVTLSSENGEYVDETFTAVAGDTVYITLETNIYYEMDTLEVISMADGSNVSLSEISSSATSGEWSFTMPDSDVAIFANFTEATWYFVEAMYDESMGSVTMLSDYTGEYGDSWLEAYAGDTIYVTVEAYDGYEFASLEIVNMADYSEISAEIISSSTQGCEASFTMPDSEVIVLVYYNAVSEPTVTTAPSDPTATPETYTVTLNVSGGYAYLVDAEGNEYSTNDEPTASEAPADATATPISEPGASTATPGEATEAPEVSSEPTAEPEGTATPTAYPTDMPVAYSAETSSSAEYKIPAGDTVMVLAYADGDIESITIMLDGMVIEGNTFTMPYYDVAVDVIIETSEEPVVTTAPTEVPTSAPSEPTEEPEYNLVIYTEADADSVKPGDSITISFYVDRDIYMNVGSGIVYSYEADMFDVEYSPASSIMVMSTVDNELRFVYFGPVTYTEGELIGTVTFTPKEDTPDGTYEFTSVNVDVADYDYLYLDDALAKNFSIVVDSNAAEPTPTPTVEPSDPTGVTSVAWTAADSELNAIVLAATSDGDAFEYSMEGAPTLHGYGAWSQNGSQLSYTHTNGVTYSFTNKGWQAGSGGTTKRCFYFTPEQACIVTVAYTAQAGRPMYIYQGSTLLASGEEGANGTSPATIEADIEDPTAGDIYIYGGSSNKQLYGIFVDYYEEVIFSTPTPEPTATPTLEPTATPTLEPTATPTLEPTATPTLEPTATPTLEPTATPTLEPTATPTLEPTATPTLEPTATPTLEPTATPTLEPTATPTLEPTATPTAEPVVLSGISVVSLPSSTTVVEGTALDITGLSISASYSDGTTSEITDYTLSGYDMNTVGTQTITVAYGEFTAAFDITVEAKSLTSVSIAQMPNVRTYNTGDVLDLTGLVISAAYNNETSEEISDYTVTGYDGTVAGLQTITVEYGGYTASFTVTVKETIVVVGTAATPQINIASFAGGKTITLTSTDEGAVIYYTTDGSVPTTESYLYYEPIELTETATIKAISTVEGMNDSKAASGKISVSQVGEISASHEAGELAIGTIVTLSSATNGTTIYYTTDGSIPTTDSAKYSGGIAISTATTIKAIAVKDGYRASDIYSVSYTVPTKQAESATISISSVTSKAGENVSVPMYVFIGDDELISFCRFTVSYDSSVLEYASVTAADGVSAADLFTAVSGETVTVLYSGSAIESGEICSLNFKVLESAEDGDYALSASGISLKTDVSDAFDISTIDGKVTLKGSTNSTIDKYATEVVMTNDDGSGEEITSVDEISGSVSANVTIDSDELDTETVLANVIITVYDKDGALIVMQMDEVDLSNLSTIFTSTVKIPDGAEVGSVKLYIWDDLGEMTPMTLSNSIF